MGLLIHPAYFPNCLTMAALAQFQVTWEVCDNFQKQTFRNRCYIATDRGPLMLNIPIRHVGGSHGRQYYRDVRIDNTYNWQRQHWRSLETAYRSTPFFEYYEAEIRPLFEKSFEYLLDLNFATIEVLCCLLELSLPEERTPSYQKVPDTLKDGRELIRAKGSEHYELPTYPQVFQERHGFLSNLSTLDLLFNEGTGANSYLQSLDLPWNA